MSLTAASTFARRARNARSAPPGALISLQSSVLACYRPTQTRSFRFWRIWSSYQDPEVQRDLYRRRQGLEYKCCQNLNRRLSWYKPTFTEDVKSTLKRVVHHNWHPYRWVSRSAGRYMNTVASPRTTPDNPEGVRPGYSIEDAERAPLEHLLFGGKGGQRAVRRVQPSAMKHRAVAASSNPDNGYVIDPITNRKVSRTSLDSPYSTSDQGVEIPAATFESYRSQFAPFRAPEVRDSQIPIFSDGPPPEAELRMYAQDKVWGSGDRSSRSRPGAQSQSEQPPVCHYGAPPSTLLDTLRWEHKEVRWHQNESITSATSAPVNGSCAHDPDATEYLDLHRYTAVRYHEPDGKPLEQQPSSKPEDLDKYDAVRSHEPDGKYKVEPESYIKSHELDKYGAFCSHEPDGKYTADYTEPPDEAELAEYSKPFRSHEPDGKYAASYIEPGCDQAELAKYRDPFFCYEPDGKYAASYIEPKPDQAELSQYKAFRSHEPDGKYAAANHAEQKPVSGELATYGPFRSHEPDGKYVAKHAETKPDSDELATYGPFRSNEPDGKYAASSTTPAAESADTKEYQAFRSHEPNGKYAAGSGVAEEAQDLGNHEAFSYEDVETRPPFQERQESAEPHDLKGYRTIQPEESDGSGVASLGNGCYDPAELVKYQAVRWNEPDGKPAAAEMSGKSLFEYDLKNEAPVTDPVSSSYGRDSPHEKPPHLTGNYVRDFPEDFATTWNIETSSETVASTSETPEPVQPALERCDTQKPGAETRNAAVKPSAKLTSPTKPALYKVLVYDPTMQCIETAETTSVVLDSAAPLTPAEVLLRMSNPAKFFPHFAPLQDQGFEIVSGSGDVLIFRKIREATTEAQQTEHAFKATAGPATVNPIDMTGGRRDYTVAAGRFASPTGFVNYDLPAESAARPERDTSRGEAAASEKKAEGGRVGKRSLPKRVVVGTAWLAGISYSIGVVSEYFNTGGSDGKGPKGL